MVIKMFKISCASFKSSVNNHLIHPTKQGKFFKLFSLLIISKSSKVKLDNISYSIYLNSSYNIYLLSMNRV